ncbi:hypothetical protein [Pseudomonas ovata]|uniref:hypothetical protein n=1 Tax=Pseudomonas ovata TaxID=1839709 RepID=UPI000D69A585|nr:hypothetical protein [Pseudomonas ovata]
MDEPTRLHPAGPVLTGIELEQLLDRLVEGLQADDADPDAVRAVLREQPMRADSLNAIGRLHSLWMRVGDPPAARAVLKHDGATLLAALPERRRPEVHLNLLLMRVRVAWFLNEVPAMLEALEALRALVHEPVEYDLERYRDERTLADLENGCLEVALKSIEVRHAMACADPERSALRARDEAERYKREAGIFERHGHPQQACEAALHAVAALAKAGDDQRVELDDWYWLGHALIEIMPAHVAQFEPPIIRLTEGLSLPLRREAQVRIARLAARALYAQGNLAQALETCKKAAFSLDAVGGDSFLGWHLPWLIEAGQLEAAGRRALRQVYELEHQLWPGVPGIIAQRLQDPDDQQVWWPLCVLLASSSAPVLDAFVVALPARASFVAPLHPLLEALYQYADDRAAPGLVFARARAWVQQLAPGHPWLIRLTAVHDAAAGLIDPAIEVALLEQAIAQSALDDARSAVSLFEARVKAQGLIEALQYPLAPLASGMDAYNYAASINPLVEAQAEALSTEDHDLAYRLLRDVQRTAFEQGRKAMEHYFATGTGHAFDACAHLYSMLCNNLAINYCHYNEQGRYQEAIELHHLGLAASVLAEHYHGLLTNQIRLAHEPELVEAAEQLWYYAERHGYSRHYPDRYIIDVAFALKSLGRSNEILIWLERLFAWQQEQGITDQELDNKSLYARLEVARCLSDTHPDNALALWSRYAPLVHASGRGNLHYSAAGMFGGLDRIDDAIDYYQRAIALFNPEGEHYERDVARVQARIAGLTAVDEDEDEPEPEPEPAVKKWWQVWK